MCCMFDIDLFAPFPLDLLDFWEFCRPATQVTPSVSPVQDAAVSEHLQFILPTKDQRTDADNDTLKTQPLSFH